MIVIVCVLIHFHKSVHLGAIGLIVPWMSMAIIPLPLMPPLTGFDTTTEDEESDEDWQSDKCYPYDNVDDNHCLRTKKTESKAIRISCEAIIGTQTEKEIIVKSDWRWGVNMNDNFSVGYLWPASLVFCLNPEGMSTLKFNFCKKINLSKWIIKLIYKNLNNWKRIIAFLYFFTLRRNCNIYRILSLIPRQTN